MAVATSDVPNAASLIASVPLAMETLMVVPIIVEMFNPMIVELLVQHEAESTMQIVGIGPERTEVLVASS